MFLLMDHISISGMTRMFQRLTLERQPLFVFMPQNIAMYACDYDKFTYDLVWLLHLKLTANFFFFFRLMFQGFAVFRFRTE